jgi:hypothetical protein
MALIAAPRRKPKARVPLPPTAGKLEINPTLVKLVHLLEESIAIPGTNARFGLDSVVGLVPVVGDLLPLVFGYFLMREAKRLGMSKYQLSLMATNYALDVIGGLVPVVGDIWDFTFKANKKNLRLLQKHVERTTARQTP